MKKPVVIFGKQSDDCNINSVVQFFENDSPDIFADILVDYFSYNKRKLFAKKGSERKMLARDKLTVSLSEYKRVVNKTINRFQNYWNSIEVEIINQLEIVFEIKFRGSKKYCAYLTINPICPRYLDNCSFEVNFKSSPQYAAQIVINELIHFVWFEKWKSFFKDYDKKEFESPYPIWLFSEIAIEPIIRNSSLNKFLETSQPAYNYFYKKEINNQNLFDIMNDLFNKNNIESFMKKGLEIVKQNYNLLID